MIDTIRNKRCCFDGKTPAEVARELADALANSEDFILYCYWAECVEGRYLEELQPALERYFIDTKWEEFRRKCS